MIALAKIKQASHHAFLAIQGWCGIAFGRSHNPLHHLGALAFYFYYIVLASGTVYLFIFFDPNIGGGPEAGEYSNYEQSYPAGVIRGLHRYASDAMLLIIVLHLARGFLAGRYRGPRFFSWASGAPMLLLVLVTGIAGYCLVWDQLGQFIALRTAGWIGWPPVTAESTAPDLLANANLTDLFFKVLLAAHLGLPVLLLGAMLLHVSRLNKARINPPPGLAKGALLAVFAMSLIKPVLSHVPAEPGVSPADHNFDWFYLFIYPLMDLWAMGPA